MDVDEIRFWSISYLILTTCVACKFEIDQKWSLSKSIFQKSSADWDEITFVALL